jgi:hypothetical protein
MSVKDTRNYSLTDRLKEFNGARVRVGIVGKSDSKLLTYAAVNEYGANIKITPKMRKLFAFNRNIRKIRNDSYCDTRKKLYQSNFR